MLGIYWGVHKMLLMDLIEDAQGAGEPEGTGMRLDILRRIMDDLDANDTLKELLGTPPTENIAIVAMDGELNLYEPGMVKLTDEQKKSFVAEVDAILKRRIAEAAL